MSRRTTIIAMLALFTMVSWSGAQSPDDSNSGGEWERVEPAEPPAASPAPAAPPQAVQRQSIPPELCESLGTAVGQLAVLRDRGVPRDQLTRTANTHSANGDVAQHVVSYIAYVYDHPEMSPGEIKAQVTANCAGPHH